MPYRPERAPPQGGIFYTFAGFFVEKIGAFWACYYCI